MTRRRRQQRVLNIHPRLPYQKKKRNTASLLTVNLTSELRGGVNFLDLNSYQTNDPF